VEKLPEDIMYELGVLGSMPTVAKRGEIVPWTSPRTFQRHELFAG